jgi:hypothetical protein
MTTTWRNADLSNKASSLAKLINWGTAPLRVLRANPMGGQPLLD